MTEQYNYERELFEEFMEEHHHFADDFDLFRATRNSLRERISEIMSDTAPSWKHRCFQICSALDLDYGEPDGWIFPDEWDRYRQMEIENKVLKELIKELAWEKEATSKE